MAEEVAVASPPTGEENYEPIFDEGTLEDKPVEEKPVDPDVPAEAEKPVEAEKPTAELLAQAERVGLEPDEIEGLSPKQLEKQIRQMNRFGQRVWDLANEKKPAPEPEKTPAPAVYDLDKNEKMYEPELIETMRAAREARAELKALKEQQAAYQAESRAEKLERVHLRVDGLVSSLGEGAVKALDRSTSAGKKAFGELLVNMGALQSAGKELGVQRSEKELLEMSIRAMGIDMGAKQSAKEAALKAKEEEFDAGSLSSPVSRSAPGDTKDALRELLTKKRMPVSKPSDHEVEWQD